MSIEGINVEPVTAWMHEHVEGVTPPLEFELIAGGHSNLTFGVTDQRGERYVLRRPPLHQVLATAHDMGREHRIISALGPTPVPVPPALGFCDDDAVNGAPFYVMAFLDGHVVRDIASAERLLSVDQRRRAGESLADVLAAIHAVDPDEVGLGQLGRKEDYIARQLKRWNGQFQSSKTREVPLVEEVHDLLAGNIPQQGPATIVHGDYRLDNCMLSPDGSVMAVLDWEICTLGDPLADVGLLMVYWADPDDTVSTGIGAATVAEGFPSRRELIERYATASGRDVSDVGYFVAFGYWKLACILEGVYARYKGGAMGGSREGFEGFGEQVVRLAEAARASIEEGT
jgi:aminoglycoside phosphotransferase (APT) family kinase protein